MPEPPAIALRDGRAIPQLGLGVFQIAPGATRGRRSPLRSPPATGTWTPPPSTATRQDVGAAIRASGLAPESVWVTTKLANGDQGAATARRAFEASLERLGLDGVDLYLLHWPHERRLESWRVLEQLHAEGLARSIGVSNFLVRHLDELLAQTSVPPAVNQIELSPFLYRTPRGHAAPLRRGGDRGRGLQPAHEGPPAEPRDRREHRGEVGRTPAQVLIRWSVQKGFVVLPRSSNPARIAENAAVFDFALDDAPDREARRARRGPHDWLGSGEAGVNELRVVPARVRRARSASGA